MRITFTPFVPLLTVLCGIAAACSSSSTSSSGSDSGAADGDGGIASDTGSADASDGGGDAAVVSVTGSATVTGSIAFPTPKDAIAFNREGLLTLKITDYSGACALEEMDDTHKQSSHYLELYLNMYPGTAGGLAVPTPAQASYFTRDATCTGSSVSATSGTIMVTSITSSVVIGNFALSFGADQVAGTFTAPVCGGGVLVGSGGGACVP